jgi:hypothetical protein
MHQRHRGRSLSVESLTAELASTPEYANVVAAQVKYHRDRLLAAELLPV